MVWHSGSLGLTYRFFTGVAQIPFGFGLSYTTFNYSKLMINSTSAPQDAFAACDVIGITVDVTNTGSVIADEVVQVYLNQPSASMPVPRIRLAAFERVYQIAPGTTRTVTLAVWPEWHSVVGNSDNVYAGHQVVEKGTFNIFVGGKCVRTDHHHLLLPFAVTH